MLKHTSQDGGDFMSYEEMHEFYEKCKRIEFNEASDLIDNTVDMDEKSFFALITDYVLQIKQKQVIAEKRF